MTLMAASKDHEVWLQNNKSRDTEMHANLCSITTTEITELTTKTHDDDSLGKFFLNYSSAINILDRAQLSLASFQSLVNLSESGTEI